ncbi:hypothetical protein ACP70R_014304 [Stipagrostis hirtigluma subsp. patula]
MDSTHTRTAKQTAPSGNGDDLIGGLNDDVLLHVLRYLPTAHDLRRSASLQGWTPRRRAACGSTPSPAPSSHGALEISTASWPRRARVDAWLRLAIGHVHGQGDRLGEMLSSPCCPRLRRLSLEFLSGLTELRLEAGVLEFLELALFLELRWLQVDAGGLGSLCIKGCFVAPEDRAGTAATIRAPALRELSFFSTSGPELLELDGWSSVTRLEKIGVRSHLFLTNDDDAGENDFAIELLRRSTSVRRHHVCLKIPQEASMGLGPAVDMSQPQSSQTQGSQRTAYNSSNHEPHSSQPEVQQQGPVWMNNHQGVGLYHEIEGGPRIRPMKLFPVRRQQI